jgi:hypothetical protein
MCLHVVTAIVVIVGFAETLPVRRDADDSFRKLRPSSDPA